MTKPVVSVLIVNWRSGEMTRSLVRDLRRQRLPGLAAGEGLEFVVTDNASGGDEETHLAALEEDGVTVIRSAQNSGYAAGMNLAAEQATGEFVFICNPDIKVFRGGLAALVEHLRANEDCGMAGPKGYLDPHRFFLLPPTELPSLRNLVAEACARTWTSCGLRHARSRSRRAVRQWTATGPVSVSQLPGFALLMDRDLARELGPFDASYPFYYEDSDLSLRLHRRGFTTDYVPRSEVVHFYNRSAGQAQGDAMSKHEVSRRLFFRARYGFLGRGLAEPLLRSLAGGHKTGHLFADIEDLGEREQVPVLDVPGHGAYVAEISADPAFVFAAGRLDVTRRFRIPDVVWDGFVDATYYVRFLERRSLDILRTVSMRKVGGSKPLTAETATAELVHT